MNSVGLSKCLTHLTLQQWCESLNRRAFLWPARERLAKHLGAKLAEGRQRIVLALETCSVLQAIDVNLFEL